MVTINDLAVVNQLAQQLRQVNTALQQLEQPSRLTIQLLDTHETIELTDPDVAADVALAISVALARQRNQLTAAMRSRGIDIV
jgi:hypothetical protein